MPRASLHLPERGFGQIFVWLGLWCPCSFHQRLFLARRSVTPFARRTLNSTSRPNLKTRWALLQEKKDKGLSDFSGSKSDDLEERLQVVCLPKLSRGVVYDVKEVCVHIWRSSLGTPPAVEQAMVESASWPGKERWWVG